MASAALVEPIDLETVKEYLRVLDDVEDLKIEAMIPRARLWVEEHTGLALVQREFVELHTPRGGVVRLYRGPLVSVGGVGYADAGGAAQTFEPTSHPPSTKLTGSWPSNGSPFEVTYTAGFAAGEVDDRLIGAMLALIEGEYSEGAAYPPEAVTKAVNACFYMKFVAP
jgi:uncharacterized phiE125 gp8 family phage protein